MFSIQQTCQPRQDILQGSFNPAIFTASLSQVVDHYRSKPAVTHALYTDAAQFFRDATYATAGLHMVLTEVFSRLAGGHSAPALHRLETVFGGGKTHTLIALTHPTFIEFLTQKLATLETFQGTRGVLRVLAVAVRRLWSRQQHVPMIHTYHLDVRDACTVNEILGRTGGGDLLPVLNTDVGGADTASLAAGQSRAQLADQKNPHPDGFPLFEYTWKTVFLHSLVGRAEGLGSNLFGIAERDALFEVACPGLPPPQIEIALHEIEHSAYFLRFRQGRYYASLEPSIPRALAGIRNDLRGEEIWSLLDVTARKVADKRPSSSQVEHDVSAPEHIPDKANTPVLALIALGSDEIDIERFVTAVGPNRPRLQQNLVFLQVPETVHVKGELRTEGRVVRAQEFRNHLEDLAHTVLAMRQLKERPENHGITPTMLREQNFDTTLAEREHALVTTVSQTYDRVWFPSASGQLVDREIKTAGGEGGAPVIERIRETLSEAGELITADKATTHETLLSLSRLLFETSQTPAVASLRKQFACQRRWQVLEEATLLESIVQAGVEPGHWCLFRMGSAEEVRPEQCFSRDSGALPLDLDLNAAGWSLVTTQEARQRGWLGSPTADPSTVERWVANPIAEERATYVSQVVQRVQEQHGEVPQQTLLEAVQHVVQTGRAITFGGTARAVGPPAWAGVWRVGHTATGITDQVFQWEPKARHLARGTLVKIGVGLPKAEVRRQVKCAGRQVGSQEARAEATV